MKMKKFCMKFLPLAKKDKSRKIKVTRERERGEILNSTNDKANGKTSLR